MLEGDLRAVDLTLVRGWSCQVSSAHCARLLRGWPFEIGPPDGFDHLARPPWVVSSASTGLPPSPSARSQVPRRSATRWWRSSRGFDGVDVVGSDPGLGVYLLGGLAGHVCADGLVALLSSKLLFMSVTMACPTISIA